MKLKNLILTFFFSTLGFTVFAQTAKQLAMKHMIDSIKLAMLSDYATRYPMLRQGFLATDVLGSRSVTGKLNDKTLYDGNMTISRIRSNFNIPFAQWGKNAITGTLSYQQIHFETKDITSYSSSFAGNDRIANKSTVGFTATFSRSDSIFNHPVNYSGGFSGLTDEFSSIKRVNYIGTVSFPVKRTPTSSLTLGMVVIIDPSSVFPVVPIISYWHKYSPSLELFVDLPSRVALRKQVSKKSWLFLGSELGGSLFFFNLDNPGLPQSAVFSSIEVRSGANFEYLVTKKLVVGLSGGLNTTPQSRMFDRNGQSSDYFFKTNSGSSPYLSISVSFLPFIKSLNK